MKTFDDLIFKQITPTRIGARIEFDNGYGISVVTGENCLYHLCVIVHGLESDTFHECNSEKQVTRIINIIQEL